LLLQELATQAFDAPALELSGKLGDGVKKAA
jgi:hypothetical protein